MHNSLQMAVAFALSIARIQALPSPAPAVGDIENGMTLREVSQKDDMTFTVFEGSSSGLERRQGCEGNSMTCNGDASWFTSHTAAKATCHLLIDSLDGYPVPDSPRSYCLNQGGERCCVSWGSVPPDGTVFGDFKDAATALNDVCGNNPEEKVSGKQSSAAIHGGCLEVCLSSRPDGC